MRERMRRLTFVRCLLGSFCSPFSAHCATLAALSASQAPEDVDGADERPEYARALLLLLSDDDALRLLNAVRFEF
jgi:hypothetical protein